MNKFFTLNVNPTMTAAQQLTFADGDLLVDWYAFDIPNGGNKLISAYMTTKSANGVFQTHHPEIYFAKDLVVGDTVIAPKSLGTINASTIASAMSRNNLIGFLQAEEATQIPVNLDFVFMQRLSTVAKNGNAPDIILQGEPGTGTSKGYSRIYVAITSTDGDPDFRSTIKTNGGGTAGDATLTVDTVVAMNVRSVGDVLIDEDEQEIGTVANVTATVITFDKNGLLNTVGDNKNIYSKSPLRLVLGFER